MKRKRALLLTTTVVPVLCVACGVWLHVQKQQYNRNRALIAVLTANDTKTALSLVNAGADPNTRQNPTPAPSLLQLLKQVLHHTPPPTNDSPTAFMMACGGGFDRNLPQPVTSVILDEDVPLVQAMLAHGANVHADNLREGTALYGAAHANHLRTAELLLMHGADVNARHILDFTPLFQTVYNGDTRMAHLLLTHGADPNALDFEGNTVLFYALDASNARQLCAELLAHRADPNLCNKQGTTTLQLAQQAKRPDLVRLLKGGVN